MRVKSNSLGACVIGMFLLLSTSFGALYQDGDMEVDAYGQGLAAVTWNSSYVSARASTSYPFSTAGARGWNEMWTSTAGFFSWGYTIDAYATFSLTFGPPSSTIYAQGGASAGIVSPFGSNAVSANAGYCDTGSSGYIGWPDDPPSSSSFGYDYFLPYEGLRAEHAAGAAASVSLPSGGEGHSRGDADASCGMY